MNVEALFDRARAIADPAERARFLDQVCTGNSAGRREVESLLSAHFAGDNPLDVVPMTGAYQPGASASERNANEQIGERIGPYKLLQLLGEGGMGSVWVAEQEQPVKRRVALKLIKAGMDSNQVLRRFEAERQALALMDHTNIARVLDAGTTPNGRPYFAMELVKGVPITKYCDELHLSLRERMELFVPICQAIQHAHQKGIIHRDIKPSNVLVAVQDGKPVPKVIDFGVAKAIQQRLTDQSMYTEIGAVIGTLEYMSPEQAELSALDIDTRADVYALGVLLYELLTGTTPIDRKRLKQAAFVEALRMIKEEEPSKPSTRLTESKESIPSLAALRRTEPAKLTKALRGELDWIVMKCLEKDRTRRYETANGLARDIQRHLSDEAVEACPPSAAYRLRKLARRYRRALITTIAFVALLFFFTFGTTWVAIRALRAERRESLARAAAETEARRAQKAEDETLAAYRAGTDDAIEQLISSKPELGPQEKAYLNNTLERWKAFAKRSGNDERSLAIGAEGCFRVAQLWRKLGRDEEARAGYENALELCTKLIKQYPTVPAYQQYLAVTHGNLGDLLADLNQNAAARAEYLLARDIEKKLVSQFPGMHEYQHHLAITHSKLGDLSTNLGQGDAAREEYENARELQKKLVERLPDQPVYQHDLANTQNNLGKLLDEHMQREAARVEYQSARDLQKKLVERFPSVSKYQQSLAITQNNLGKLLANLGQRIAAQVEYQSARDLQRKLIQQFPAVPEFQHTLAYIQNNLGNLLDELGQCEAARREYQSARDTQKQLVERYPTVPSYQQSLALTHFNLGYLLDNLKQLDDARGEYQSARDLQKKLVEQYPAVPAYQQNLARTHNCLAILFKKQGQLDEALGDYRSACAIQKCLVELYPAVAAYQQDLARTHYNMGNCHRSLRQHEAARAEYQSAGEWLTRLVRTFPSISEYQSELADTHNALGLLFSDLGNRSEAEDEYRKALAISEKLAADFPGALSHRQSLAEGHYNLACHYAIASRKNADTKQEFANRAMESLWKAVQFGYNDSAHLKKDSDLDPLRDRDDFKKLIAELEKASAKP